MKTLIAIILALSFITSAHAQPIQIGDSITIRCAPQLAHYGIRAEGRVGAQFYDGVDHVQWLRLQHDLSRKVIIALGTNGAISYGQIYEMMGLLSHVNRVYFVTVHADRSWTAEANGMMRFAKNHWKKVELIDWAAASESHPEWFEDGIHPTVTGCENYARLIGSVVNS